MNSRRRAPPVGDSFASSPCHRGGDDVCYPQSTQWSIRSARRSRLVKVVGAEQRSPVAVRNLVAGRWSGGQTLERVGPSHGHVVSTPAQATGDLADEALEFARTGALEMARWSPAARAEVLERAATLVFDRRDEIAVLLALELGKPLKDGRGETVRAAETLSVCAAEARRIGGEVLPTAGWARGVGTVAMTMRAPVGVVVAITPFNAPVNLLAHKLSASFAAGNTTLVKPPPQAPASSTRFVQLLMEAGLPASAVQVLHGGADIGAALTG